MCRHSSQTARVQSGRVLAWFRTYEQGFLLLYMKQIASPGSMHETGCSGPVYWDNSKGKDGEGGGGGGSGWVTHVHPWLVHVNVWQKLLQYCKVISLQLK